MGSEGGRKIGSEGGKKRGRDEGRKQEGVVAYLQQAQKALSRRSMCTVVFHYFFGCLKGNLNMCAQKDRYRSEEKEEELEHVL